MQTNLLRILMPLLLLGAATQSNAENQDRPENSEAVSKPVFILRMADEGDRLGQHYEVGKRIRFQIVEDLPASLASTKLKGLFWPIDNTGKLLPRPDGLIGIAPINLISPNSTTGPRTYYMPNGRTSKKPVWVHGRETKDAAFTGFVIVYKFIDEYDYAVVGNSKLDLIKLVSDLGDYAIFDDVRISKNRVAYTLISERDQPVRWRAVDRWFMNSKSATYSLKRTKSNFEFDFELYCLPFGLSICDASEFRPQLGPDEAFTELTRYRKYIWALRDAAKERRVALEEANRRQNVADANALLSSFEVVALNSGECAETASYRFLSEPVSGINAWHSALAIDRRTACSSVPVPVYNAFRKAKSARMASASDHQPKRDYWKELNEAISNAPSILKCTKDYTKGTENCTWVRP